MTKQIEKSALKAVNKVLAQHNCRVVRGAGPNGRYVVQRKRLVANNYGAVGNWFAIGLAYADKLSEVLRDDTLRINKQVGANGWYGAGPNGDNYMPVTLDEREALQVELALA